MRLEQVGLLAIVTTILLLIIYLFQYLKLNMLIITGGERGRCTLNFLRLNMNPRKMAGTDRNVLLQFLQ